MIQRIVMAIDLTDREISLLKNHDIGRAIANAINLLQDLPRDDEDKLAAVYAEEDLSTAQALATRLWVELRRWIEDSSSVTRKEE